MRLVVAMLVSCVLTALPTPAFSGALCALAKAHYAARADQPPTNLARNQMSQVNSVLCKRFRCPPYRLWSTHTAGNAQAYLSSDGAYIRYNSQFMGTVINNFGELATIGILAHELGHLIDFSTNQSSQISQFYREATADEYAGCAFALAGAHPTALGPLQQTLFAMGSSPGYPNSQERAALIASDYNKCR